ncbi:MAG: hypothetical protein KAQ74_00475 [Dehalococcoidia bacterium]|nr:hypothetical protein [Dehalococcoidia bacterium]
MEPEEEARTVQYVHLPEGSDEHSGQGVKAHWAEHVVALGERKVLYLLTDAVVDTVCCGDRTFHYATVLGYVSEWQSMKDEHGLPVSTVEPVIDPSQQGEIESLLKKDDSDLQVSFRSE